MIKAYLQLIRPNQWVKNTLIFVPIIFSLNLFDGELLVHTIWIFLLFCVLASGVYIMNDLFDMKRDQKHPIKKKRPLAAGKIKKEIAIGVGLLHFGAALAGLFWLDQMTGFIGVTYVFINILYSIWLKHIPIIDVFTVTSNYVIRLIIGVFAIDVSPTKWLLIAGTLVALFLVLGKRRHELVLLGEKAESHRGILKEYSPYLIDQMIIVVTSALLVVYCLYTFDEAAINLLGTPYLPLTIPFVFYGLFRYLYLVHQKKIGGDPTREIFQDLPLMLNIVFWGITVVLLIYGVPYL